MKKKLKIIIPIVVLIVLIAVGTAVYFLTDLFKSPKKLFYKYAGETFQAEKGHSYDDFLSDFEFYYEKANKTNAEISVEALSMDTLSKDSEPTNSENLGKLNDFKLNVLSEVGPKQEKAYTKVGLDYKNENLTTIEYLNSNNNYGLKCADIYKDYFYVDNGDLKSLATKLGVDSENIPDSISKINIYDLINVNKEKRKSIYNRYYKIIDSELDKDNFESDKGVKVNVNGKEVKTNSYTLTLTADEVLNILSKVCDTLKDDDETLDLVLEKYDMVAEDIKTTDISKDDLKKAIDDLKSSLDEANSTSTEKMKITVYESKGKTVKLTATIGEDVLGLDITKNKKDGAISLYLETNGKVQVCIKNEYTIDNDTTTGKITFSSFDKVSTTIDYTYVKSNSKISLDASLSSTYATETDFSLSFKFEITGDNLNKRPTKFDFNSSLEFIANKNTPENMDIVIHCKGSTEFTDSIDIPDLGKSNGVCINTVTDEELKTIKTDINTNINTFIDKILTKFNLTRTEAGLPEGNVNIIEELENTTTKLQKNTNFSEIKTYPVNTVSPGGYNIDPTKQKELEEQAKKIKQQAKEQINNGENITFDASSLSF